MLVQKELKNAYIGKYQEWWQPWVNTIAYYPLDSTNTVNDMSGNSHTLTNNWATFWTYQWVDCWAFLNDTNAYASINTLPLGDSDRTLSAWVYIVDVYSSQWDFFWYGTESNWKDSSLNQIQSGFNWIGFRRRINDAVDTSWIIFTWAWHHMVWVKNSSGMYFYYDWNLLASSIGTTMSTEAYTLYLGKWVVWTDVSVYLSNAIVEDKAWTAQEISDYYNQTKSLYGIS